MIRLQDISNQIKTRGKYWIVFTGDSITSCEWVHPNWREIVEYVLKQELTKIQGDWKNSSWSLRAFNFAYDGATTGDILAKVELIKQVQPDLVISVMGSNDPAFKLTVSEHVENIQKIIKRLNTNVVWCTSTPAFPESSTNNQYRPYTLALMQIPARPNLQLVDVFNLYQQFPLKKFFTFTSDPVHPNQLGNAYLAKIVLKEVFDLEFDPQKYIEETLSGQKYPGY
jgi:lysophospholipase L1-like esterase